MRALVWFAGLGLAAASAAYAEPSPAQADPALARGAHLAQRDCAACHAVTAGAASPNPGAPSFSDLRLRYNPISLEKRLAAFPESGHEAMPPRSLQAADIPDLVAYIQAVDTPVRTP